MRCGSMVAVFAVAPATLVGAQCTPVWSGHSGSLGGPPWSITSWDPDGAGPAAEVLIAGGNLLSYNFVAAWDGAAWSQMATGVSGTVSVCGTYVFAGQTSQRLVIGGSFGQSSAGVPLGQISEWNSGAWTQMAGGLGPALAHPEAMIHCGPGLLVTGWFDRAGGIPVAGIALWNGAQWASFNDERAGGADDLCYHESRLIAGGYFLSPIPVSFTTGVLRYDGQAWQAIGTNYPLSTVDAVASYQGRLYAGGSFDFSSGGQNNPAEYIAVWDGNTWSPVGAGLNGPVRSMQVFDPDGPNPYPEKLYVGGAFTIAGGQPATCIASWDGQNWSPLGSGVWGAVDSMTVWRNKLAVAGNFNTAGGITSPGVAFWGCPIELCYANCDRSTTPPALNVADFTCFLRRFAFGDEWANCDENTAPPVLNVADFTCFLQRFAAGCP